MFASPLFLMGSTLAALSAALFHLALGKGWVDWVLYWFIALLGFSVGQAMADIFRLRWLLVGQTHIIEALVACWLAMFVARWLKV